MNGTIIFDLEGTLVDVGGPTFSQVFISESQLQRLAQEYEIAIVTGATREQLMYVLENSFLGEYFTSENTVTKDDCSAAKKTGEPFQLITAQDSFRRYVILGDSEGDRLGAEVLGIPFVLVSSTALANDKLKFQSYLAEAVVLLG